MVNDYLMVIEITEFCLIECKDIQSSGCTQSDSILVP